MKKILFLFATLSLAISASAVTPEEMKESEERIEQLENAEKPETFKLDGIAAYVDKAWELRENTLEMNEKLAVLYDGTLGDGESEAVTEDDAKECYKNIEERAKLLTEAATLAAKATADIKNAKGTDKLKAPKSVKTTTELIALMTKETAYQTKLITDIIASFAQ